LKSNDAIISIKKTIIKTMLHLLIEVKRCKNIDQKNSDQDDAAIQDNKNRDTDTHKERERERETEKKDKKRERDREREKQRKK
jgi:hypothetical protein